MLRFRQRPRISIGRGKSGLGAAGHRLVIAPLPDACDGSPGCTIDQWFVAVRAIWHARVAEWRSGRHVPVAHQGNGLFGPTRKMYKGKGFRHASRLILPCRVKESTHRPDLSFSAAASILSLRWRTLTRVAKNLLSFGRFTLCLIECRTFTHFPQKLSRLC